MQQTHAASQIIVVVDGDCPEARAFFSELGEPSLKVFYLPKNRGSAAARNLGVEHAFGDWIAFLDSDDLWTPRKLEVQIDFLRSNPSCQACHTGVDFFNQHSEVIASYIDKPRQLEAKHLLNGNQVLTSSLVIRRDAFLKAGGFDTSFRTSQDFEFIFRVTRQKMSIGFVPEALTLLRRANHGNISSNGGILLGNHLRLAWRYRADIIRPSGLQGLSQFVAKYLVEDGSRMPGLLGRLTYCLGRLIQIMRSKSHPK